MKLFRNAKITKKATRIFLLSVLALSMFAVLPQDGNAAFTNFWRGFKLFGRGGDDAATAIAKQKALVGEIGARTDEHIARPSGRNLNNRAMFRDLTSAAVAKTLGVIYPGSSLLTDFQRMVRNLANPEVKLLVINGEDGIGKKTLINQLAASQTAANVDDLPAALRVGGTGLENKRILSFDVDHYLKEVDGEHRKHYLQQIAVEIKKAKESGHEVLIHIDGFERLKPASMDGAGREDPSKVFFEHLDQLTENAQIVATTNSASIATHQGLEHMSRYVRNFERTAPQASEAIAILKTHASNLERTMGVSFSNDAIVQAARLAEGGYRGLGLPGSARALLMEAAANLKGMRASGEPYRIVETETKIAKLREQAMEVEENFWRQANSSGAGTGPARPGTSSATQRIDMPMEEFDISRWPDRKPFLRERRIEIQQQFDAANEKLAEMKAEWPRLKEKVDKLEELKGSLEELQARIDAAGIDEDVVRMSDDFQAGDLTIGEMRAGRVQKLEAVKKQWEEWGEYVDEENPMPDIARMEESRQMMDEVQAEIDQVAEMGNDDILRGYIDDVELELNSELSLVGFSNDVDTEILLRTAAEGLRGDATEESIGIMRAMLTGDNSIFAQLGNRMSDWIVGQENIVSDILRIMQSRLSKNETGVKGVFGLFGESRLGKTEIARALSKIFGGKKILTIEGGKFQEAHRVSALEGPPPGYKGMDEGGMLTNYIKSNPNGVVLVDELEKMNPKILDIFLTVLETGKYTNTTTGEVLDASGMTFVFTGNLLRNLPPEQAAKVAQLTGQKDFASLKKYINTELLAQGDAVSADGSRILRPELINRFDGVYIVEEFIPNQMTVLAQRMYGKYVKSFAAKMIAVRPSKHIFELIAGRAARDGSGGTMRNAANVINTIDTYIEQVITKMMGGNAPRILEGDIVDVRLRQPGDLMWAKPGQPGEVVQELADGRRVIRVPDEGVRVYINEEYIRLGENENRLTFLQRDADGRAYVMFNAADPAQVDQFFSDQMIMGRDWTVAIENPEDLMEFVVTPRGITNEGLQQAMAARNGVTPGAVEGTDDLIEGSRNTAEGGIQDSGGALAEPPAAD